MAPTAQQVSTMAKEWSEIDQVKFINVMYHKMFETHPEWSSLFKKFSTPPNNDNPAFKLQVGLTRGAFNRAVEMARDGKTETLLDVLHGMARRHVNYNVGQNEFQALKPILVEVVKQEVPHADLEAWMETVSYVLDNIVVVD